MFFWYFTEFHMVVCGLDSIIARRWINGLLVCIVLNTVNVKCYTGSKRFRGSRYEKIAPPDMGCWSRH